MEKLKCFVETVKCLADASRCYKVEYHYILPDKKTIYVGDLMIKSAAYILPIGIESVQERAFSGGTYYRNVSHFLGFYDCNYNALDEIEIGGFIVKDLSFSCPKGYGCYNTTNLKLLHKSTNSYLSIKGNTKLSVTGCMHQKTLDEIWKLIKE